MRTVILFISIIWLSWSQASAQAQFTNRNDLLAEPDLHSAVPVGIADMNGDGLDDIVALNLGRILMVQYQTPDPARPFVRYETPIILDSGEQNDIIIADFNNDGSNDLLTSGTYDGIKIVYSVPFTYEFNVDHIDVTPFFSQGASAGDFNHDGWVDVVLLNDNGLNYTLMNDGAGNLVEQDLFDFETVPPSDNSGNYGSVYSDFDMDGDLDFYIAKCRQGITNPADPRRIDVLFVNDGQGNYTQDAASYGLADGRQTWTADFGDFDNDGDLDLFKTQHDTISELYENIDNDTFINITVQSGLNIGGVPLQGMFRDFDNDGFQDILVSGDLVHYYHNNGDKTFTKTEPFGSIIFGTYSLGDLNQDGFTDVYASRVIPFNNPDLLREDILYLNQTNNNHFLSLSLKDTISNGFAIGAMALLYGPWGTQVREVRGGEQYGVTNGIKLIFGLKDQTQYDSLIIRWADGTRESFNGLEVDKTWTLHRGGCKQSPLILLNPLEVLCNDDSLVVKLDTNLEFIGWSNGSLEDTIVIKKEGLYFALLLDNGCPVYTQPMEVIIDPDSIKPVIQYLGNQQLCNGKVAVLTLPSAVSYQWSSGETTQSIEVTQSGYYFAQVEGYCKFQQSDTIYLDFLVSDLPVVTPDTFKPGETVLLVAEGDSILWFSDENGTILISTGDSLVVEDLSDTVTYYAQNLIHIQGQELKAGPVAHEGLNKYNAPSVNGGLMFEVYKDIVLHSITVFTDSVGTRIIEITNGIDFFYEHQVDLEAGTTVLELEVGLPIGDYEMSTNSDQNTLVFGVVNPYLWRSSSNVLYPYEAPGVMSITNSTLGSNRYYYFYDWKFSTADSYCASELVPVTAILDLGTATKEVREKEKSILISPNPTHGIFKVSIENGVLYDIEVRSLEGKMILKKNSKQLETEGAHIDLSSYPSGIYWIRIIQDGISHSGRILKL